MKAMFRTGHERFLVGRIIRYSTFVQISTQGLIIVSMETADVKDISVKIYMCGQNLECSSKSQASEMFVDIKIAFLSRLILLIRLGKTFFIPNFLVEVRRYSKL